MMNMSSLSSRIFWSLPDSERDRPVLGALCGDAATLVVDTGASPAHARQFRAALGALGAASPRYAVLTHWHWDHVFGTAEMGLLTIAHVETRRRVLEMARLDWRDRALDARVAAGEEVAFIADHLKIEMTNAERAALVIAAPEVTFTRQVEVYLGGLTAQVLHVGGDHSPDCSVVFCPEERVAFLGDCTSGGFTAAETYYTLPRFLQLLDALEALPAEQFFFGHYPHPVPRAQFLRENEQARIIADVVQKTAEREAVLARLPALLGEPVNEEHAYVVDALLTGLRLP